MEKIVSRNIYLSACMGLLEELVSIIGALIIPRMVLLYYGSDYNGVLSSVTQFIGVISLLRFGIGMATKAALYEPLYNNDRNRISGIMVATTEFLKKIAIIFLFIIIFFSVVFPFIIKTNFSWFFIFSLVIIVSLGTFFQYYFGFAYQLLLNADRKNYIVSLICIINTVGNTLVSFICIKLGMSIHLVKLLSAIIFCTTPIILNVYVKKQYSLNMKVLPDKESISKNWDAFGMQLANFVNDNTDIILASIFLDIREVSVYSVYYLAINGVKKIVNRISVGVEAELGKLVVEGNLEKLRKRFFTFEYILNFICIIVFSCLIVLIVPFVLLYTKGVNDTNYIRYSFAIIASLAEMFYCIRLAYTFIVQVKGDFAKTKKYYYVESLINIIISLALVKLWGLVGIVIGTFVAMVYRTFCFALYVYKNVLKVKLYLFYKRILITCVTIAINCIVCNRLVGIFSFNSFFTWFVAAMFTGVLVLLLTLMINYIFYFNKSNEFVFEYFRRNK